MVFTFLRLLVINSGALAMYFSAPRFHFALAYYWKSGAKHLRYFCGEFVRLAAATGADRARRGEMIMFPGKACRGGKVFGLQRFSVV